MGGGPIPKIPDYRIYKVEDAPQLMEVQRKLARHGLKDPWLRNEVWRYTMDGMQGTTAFTRMMRSLGRGFGYAVILTAGLVCTEKVYHKMYPPSHHDHH